jgi:hypothetical protein
MPLACFSKKHYHILNYYQIMEESWKKFLN